MLTLITRASHVEVAPHYRSTLTGPDVTTEVFLEVRSAWQVPHEHVIESLTKHGDGICYSCGVTAWSEAWVATEVHGEHTYSWADELYRKYVARLQDDLPMYERLIAEIERERFPSLTAVVADLDLDQPAKRALTSV